MGNAVPRQAAAPAQQAYVDKPERHLIEDMRSVMVVARIGNGRFLKSYHCKDEGAGLCVKVYVKQDADEDLEAWRADMARLRELLPRTECPNVLPYYAAAGRRPASRGVTGAAYLVRQHFFANLHERLGSRPFLTDVEKRWLVYQLLVAVDQCHARGVCHGDLKSENVMVTSWTWATATDLASYKPTYLPDDGPEFEYYFSSGAAAPWPRGARGRGATSPPSASSRARGRTATRAAAARSNGRWTSSASAASSRRSSRTARRPSTCRRSWTWPTARGATRAASPPSRPWSRRRSDCGSIRARASRRRRRRRRRSDRGSIRARATSPRRRRARAPRGGGGRRRA